LQANFPAGPAVRQVNRLSLWDLLQENMMVSLRLTQEGVSNLELKERYQVNILEVLRIQIDKLLRQGLLESVEHENRLRLTRKGRLFGNRVFAEFVGNPNPNDLKN
jgi:oxygen-independent coproporphyrinogen-3 oxidase